MVYDAAMSIHLQHVLTQTDSKSEKTRAFPATVLGWAEANGFVGVGKRDQWIRPALCVLACSPGNHTPVLANLRSGASLVGGKSDRFEFMKSVPYQFLSQKTEQGSIITAFVPSLFQLDTGLVEERIMFLLAPARADLPVLDEKEEHGINAHLQRVGFNDYYRGGIAPLFPWLDLFAAYLTRRVQIPLLRDRRFYAQILGKMLQSGEVAFPQGSDALYDWRTGSLRAEGLEAIGYAGILACHTTQARMAEMLAEQVSVFYKEGR